MVNLKYSTMKILTSVKKKLDTVKVHPRQTYSEIISQLIDLKRGNEE